MAASPRNYSQPKKSLEVGRVSLLLGQQEPEDSELCVVYIGEENSSLLSC